ncbi:MAG: hypothetical protein JSW05_12270 [Candidatus Thorarchaeota archaeon]|nr:MAG: hypothetical protein JSW05_12270 [Candidatus Thorarchaeota archaeon]
MNEEKDLKSLEQESFRELMHDGFTEMLLGLILAALPVLVLHPGIISIFVVFYILFLPPFLEGIRRKYIYPRIGYVKLSEDEPPKVTARLVATLVLIIVFVAAVIYSVAIGIIDQDLVYRWIPAAFGLIMWVPSVYLEEKSGQNRYYLFGALMTITGVAVALAPIADSNFVGFLYFVCWGLFFLALGLVKYALFVRRFPVVDLPEDVQDEL